MINPKYATPILTLANALSDEGIPHTINTLHDGLQIRFPWNCGDLVCHNFSYGCEDGLLESYGCPWDGDDVSCRSVDRALTAIADWYQYR